jgi:hypothetical protein
MSFHQFYYVNSVFIDFLVITLLKLYFLSVGTCYIECVLLFMSVGWDCVSELQPPPALLFIPQMIYEYGAQWNDMERGKTEEFRQKPVPVPLCPLQIPHWLTRAQTRSSIVRGWWLTAWAMAQPLSISYICMLTKPSWFWNCEMLKPVSYVGHMLKENFSVKTALIYVAL